MELLMVPLLLVGCVVASSESDATTPLDLADWVDAGMGTWVGDVTQTPLGDFPFQITLGWEQDAALYGRADNGYGFSLEFSYQVDDEGHWTFTETGSLPPKFEQSYTLVPNGMEGDQVEWITADEPDYLVVRVDHPGDTLRMEVLVRGKTHAILDLARVDSR